MEKITIYTHGSSRGNPGPASIGAQVADMHGVVVCEVSEVIGNATDNYAGYQAVLRGLQTVIEIYGAGTKELQVEIVLDNELVKKQLSSECQIQEPGLVPHFIEIHNMRVISFPNLTCTLVDEDSNSEVVKLAEAAFPA